MKKSAMLWLFLLVSGIAYPEDGMLTTPYLGFLWWEWHSSKDLQDWPKYKFHIFSDGSVEDIIYYPRSGGLKLHAQCEVLGESRIRLNYSEYTGDNVPVGYSTSVLMEIRRMDDSAYQKFALYAVDEGGSPDLILLGDQAVRSNLKKEVQGVEVVTMGAVYGSATTNVKIRSAPRITASTIRFRSPEVAGGLGYCPKETGFHVIARTAQKERVQQWTNYWYYVDIFTGRGMMPRYGWIFGQFVDFSEEEVREKESLPAWERRSLENSSLFFDESSQVLNAGLCPMRHICHSRLETGYPFEVSDQLALVFIELAQ